MTSFAISPLTDKANTAFARTMAHRLDARVRLTYDAADLAAINHDDVAAVIWKRQMPEEIRSALRREEKERHLLIGLRNLDWPALIGDGREFIVGDAGDDRIPLPLRHDAAIVKHAAFSAVGNVLPGFGRSYSFPDAAPPERVVEKMAGVLLPHVDVNYFVRCGFTYTLDPALGTEWYPKLTSPAAIDTFSDRLKQAPMCAWPAIKAQYNVQMLRPYHVMLFKGDAQPEKVRLAHNATVPKKNMLRLTNF
jgi:hypothetical protein